MDPLHTFILHLLSQDPASATRLVGQRAVADRPRRPGERTR
jgi:hypothetical protein